MDKRDGITFAKAAARMIFDDLHAKKYKNPFTRFFARQAFIANSVDSWSKL